MKFTKSALLLSASLIATPVLAQEVSQTAPQASETVSEEEGKSIVVTGSRIKRDPNDSSLPLQIITNADVEGDGINNPE